MSIDVHPDQTTVLAAVAAVPAGAHIATDADGTLWTRDTGDDLVRCGAESDVWPEVDVDAYLAFIEADYHGGCRLSAEMLRGLPTGAVQAAFRDYFAPRFGPRQWLIDALLEAERRGVTVVAVTAAPQTGAEVSLSLAGCDWPAIGVQLAEVGCVEPAPVGDGKVGAWKARGLPRPALALGDSKWDRPLLEFAERGLLVTHA